MAMITKDKVIDIFCMIDEFDKNFTEEMKKNILPPTDGKKHRNRKASLSDSEIMTILLLFHFGTYRNFKHYYIFCIRGSMKQDFPGAVSYNRFVELDGGYSSSWCSSSNFSHSEDVRALVSLTVP